MTSHPTDPYIGTNAPISPSRRLQLVWSTKGEDMAQLRVAFASADRIRVDQHFGAAEGFVVYEIEADKATLVGVGEFPGTAMDGNESKLAAKVEFLKGCAAVFVMAIGASAIQQLLAHGIQPIRVAETDQIDALLADIAAAMKSGGVAWIDRALTTQSRSADRFAAMEEEGWTG